MSAFDELKKAAADKAKAEEAKVEGWTKSHRVSLTVGFSIGLLLGLVVGHFA